MDSDMEAVVDIPVLPFMESDMDSSDDDDDGDDWAGALRLGTKKLLLEAWGDKAEEHVATQDELSEDGDLHMQITGKQMSGAKPEEAQKSAVPVIGPTLLCHKPPLFQSCEKAFNHSYKPAVIPDDLCPGEDITYEEICCRLAGHTSCQDSTPPQEPMDTCQPDLDRVPDCSVSAIAACKAVPLTPPKSVTGARRSSHERANAMVPMLRAKHMGFLDEQYLKDSDARPSVSSARVYRSASRGRRAQSCRSRPSTAMVPMLRARHMDLLDEQYLNDPDARPSSARVPRSSSCGPRAQSCKRRPATSGNLPERKEVHSQHQQRLLGPKAVMPLVKGRLKVQAETAQREADKEKREAKLKEQFRSRPSTRPRVQSQVGSTRVMNSK